MAQKKFGKKYLLFLPLVLLLSYLFYLSLWYQQQKRSLNPQLSPQGQDLLNQILKEMSP